MESESGRHRFGVAAAHREAEFRRAVGERNDLFGAVGPGPVVRFVVVGQRHLVARERGDTPSGSPAMAVQRVGMIPHIPVQTVFVSLELEHAVFNSVGKRHQRESAHV